MKRIMVFLLAAAMILSFAACGASGGSAMKLGMGVVVNNDSSSDGNAQVDATVAAVVTDKDGKIVKAALDCAQTKMAVADGVAATEDVDTRSKMQKGDDYGMKAYSDAISEWYDQANAFCDNIVGKTVDEVAAMELVKTEEGHMVAPEMEGSCTISVADFVEAVKKAGADEYAKDFTAGDDFKLGIGVATNVDGSTANATADADGTANMYSTFAVVAADADGNILADLIDAIQPQISFNKKGKIGDFTFKGSKKELKEDYGMLVDYGSQLAEWYDQAKCFEDYIVGKTPADVTAIKTVVNDEGHSVATEEDADLLAGCTISIADFQQAVGASADFMR